MRDRRIRVEWPSERAGAGEVLVAIEPTEDEVIAAAGELALFAARILPEVQRADRLQARDQND